MEQNANESRKLSYDEQIDQGLRSTKNNEKTNGKRKVESYGIVLRHVLCTEGLTWKGQLVYALLVTYQDKQGECWPSLRTLVRKLNKSINSIQAGIRELEKREIITVEKGKKGRNNHYHLNVRKDHTIETTTGEQYIDFETLFEQYHVITGLPKTDRNDAIKFWKRLSQGEQEKAFRNIGPYFDSLRDKNFCKKARTYLSGKTFNDQFVGTYREPDDLITFDDDD